ncbi:MAG: DUF2809 domain-containing protein [Candidatus Cloacimonadota bacterium]|nr:MAG: DUF2809 domain-containing protein [Candidatus Cloacimonadota bacterium]
MKNNSKFRLAILISLLIVTPLGFAIKFYNGPYDWWLNNCVAGVLYEIFWCMIIVFIIPNVPVFWIALAVFFITCSLEFLQLWHPPFLELIRSTFIGRSLIGTSFTYRDFPYYIIGCFIAWLWIKLLK